MSAGMRRRVMLW